MSSRRQRQQSSSGYRNNSSSRSPYGYEDNRNREHRMNNEDYVSDYYAGGSSLGQDRYGNSSRRQETERYGSYNRDHENRYFDEDYEGNRGFNRDYNMNSDYQTRSEHRGGNRSMYDEEHRSYDRNQPQQRMSRDWMEDRNDYYTQNRDYQTPRQNMGQHRDREQYRDYQNRERQNYSGDENYNRSDWYDEGYHRETPGGRGGSHYPDYY